MRNAGLAVALLAICMLAFSGSLLAQQADPEDPERPVSVAQLTEIVEKAKSGHDAGAVKEIAHLELTERLSSARLAMLSAKLPKAKSRAALMAVADASVFLEPPSGEIPDKAVPDLSEQKRILSLTVDYLKKTIPKLPDIYANRLTTSFELVWKPTGEKSTFNPAALRPRGEFKAAVYYLGGKEVVHAEGAEEDGLVTYGTFGPILSTVIVDAARSSMKWSRWEGGPNGPMAVFRFQVPQTESHYRVSVAAMSGIGDLGGLGSTAYHGEIGIDPDSGTILRLVLDAEPGLGSSLVRADIMVEYGAVDIGGKTYTCPVRSVSYSVGSIDIPLVFGVGWKREAARLNDVVFNSYHVFRSESRIVPYTP